MKNVLVSVTSLQRDMRGEDVKIEFVTTGKYYLKNNIQYIIYEESAMNGLEGVTTFIKIYEDSVTLFRRGNIRQKQEFKVDEAGYFSYKTPYGNLDMIMETYELTNGIKDGVGILAIDYDIFVKDAEGTFNQLVIKLEEDNSINGDERIIN